MAFDDFTKSLGDFTSDVTGKVTNTVKHPIKSMKDATDWVGKKVMGPRLDIVQQAQDQIRVEELKNLYKKTVRKWATAVRKTKASKTKITAMVKALNGYKFEGESFDSIYDSTKSFLKSVKAELKKGYYVGELEENKIKMLKKYSLTKTEQPFFEDTFKDAVDWYSHDAPEVKKNLAGSIMIAAKKPTDMDALYKAETKKLDVTHNDSMDASIELLRAWRKFFAVLRTSEKNMAAVKKLEEHKRTATAVQKKKITASITAKMKETKTLLEKEGKKAVAAISDAEEKVEKGYTEVNELLAGFVTSYDEAKTVLKQWVTANTKQTTGVHKTTAASIKKNTASHKLLVKKEKTIMTAIDSALKKPFNTPDKVSKAVGLFDANYNAQQESQLDKAVLVSTESMHDMKDHSMKSVLLNTYHSFVYGDMLLLRKNTVFLGFANRYHKNHARYAKDAWDKLIDLKRSDSTLFKGFVTLMQKKAEYYNGLIKVNNKAINTQKSQISEFRTVQWEIIKVQKLLEKEGESLENQERVTIHTGYHSALKSEVKRLSQHNKMMKRYSGDIAGAIKKTDTVLKDKEKSLNVKSTVALKKEVASLHKQKDAQEATHDTYKHYMEELQNHVQELKDLVEGYAKVGKAEKKKAAALEKSAKTMRKKVAKSTTLKELNV